MTESRKVDDLISKCEDELKIAFENGDNKRILVKILQELASQKYDLVPSAQRIEKILQNLWNHPVLLEDCILVSGIIYTKLHKGISFLELCKKSCANHVKNEEWVTMSVMRGISLNTNLPKSKDQLDQLVEITFAAINEGFTSNRSVLISCHLENLLNIFTCEKESNVYNIQVRGSQIISIINRTLRLNADLTDYKSRDLIKWHLNVLNSHQLQEEYINFATSLLDCLPEVNKITVQICDALCSFNFQDNQLITSRILNIVLPCLNIKGGLGSAAATCVGKLLVSQNNLDNCNNLLFRVVDEILGYPSTRDIIKIFNLVLDAVNEFVKENILKILQDKQSSLVNELLVFILKDDLNSTEFGELLVSGDEFVALEAFSLLTRDSIKKRRKPTELIIKNDLILFQNFMNDVIFCGSVDFRQKVSVSAKSFYEQIFARIYHLIRELSKKPREKSEVEKEVPIVVIDRECLTSELNTLFDWLGEYVKFSLVEPFDYYQANFGSVEFSFTQILSIFASFEGNATLVAANSAVLSCIASRFQSSVVEAALIPAIDNFIRCVGKSSYDSLRLQAIEIVCKCNVDSSLVNLDEYVPALKHPRAINNEGAARIILLHARISKTCQITSILDELSNCFKVLKSDFPVSLRDNNINGPLLLLRFLIQDRFNDISAETMTEIVNLSMEISTFVSEIASHPSPEGLSIASIESFNNDDEEDAEIYDEDINDVNDLNSGISSQYILSFSWRAVKETSNLLETLIKTNSSIVSKEQIYSIADHFISLLLKLRHCGAFRALQAPLSTTLRLEYSYSKKAELLQHVLDVCLGTGQITTTRRSAGLPFLVLALAHSCSNRGNELSQLLSNLIPPLLSAASDQTEYFDDSKQTSSSSSSSPPPSPSPSAIHAFNIIRSLVRDSRIASEMGPHMASVAKLCLGSFNSAHWNVRNASAMLLSSLISRIFGPKHINNISSHDHHVDLREIDVKFEGLIGVLATFLQIESADLEPRIAYPLLAVLERIRIPPNERFEELRRVVISFLSDLLEKLEKRPESGRKLGHVMARTVFSLLASKSLRIEEINEKLLVTAPKSTSNSVYNLLVLLENIKQFDSSTSFLDLLPPIQEHWHPILISKYNQITSHKYEFSAKFRDQNGTPVLSSEIILEELNKKLPNIRLICQVLETGNVSIDAVFKVVERFKLNEEIMKISLPLLCQSVADKFDDRLESLLSFYSASESNENLRFIALESLKTLNSKFFKNVPECIFSLLLDDEEEIRLGICKILNSANPLSPAETLKRFINLVGISEFTKFLENYQNLYLNFENNSDMKLFEKEPLNLFIDIKYLKKKFCSK